ncbi:MAG: hypothetical protein SFY80_06435 [Verrucomicrobiota bacterium]|nr:hypothetical protein [Verrucomicrobiota bacterium]
MPDSMLVNHKHPLRTTALQPIRRRLNNSGRNQIVPHPLVVLVHIKCRDGHPDTKLNLMIGLVTARIAVRETEYRAVFKQAVKVGVNLWYGC